MRRFVVVCVTLIIAAVLLVSGCSTAQPQKAFPAKGIDLLVAFSAGSGTDTNARLFAPSFQKSLGVPLTVVNVAEGGGAIGWSQLAKAKADGYTIGISTLPMLAYLPILTKTEYNALDSFTYLGNVAFTPGVLAVNPNGPFKTLSDLVAAAKAKPEKISVGITGKGSLDQVLALSIERASGVKFNIVSFQGTAEAVTAIMGGNLDAAGMSATSGVQYAKGGQLRMLAIGGDKRMPQLPEVPTFKESGVDLMVNGFYTQFLAPKGLPDDVKNTLVNAVKQAVDDPDVKKQASDIVLPLQYLGQEDLGNVAKQMAKSGEEFLK